MANVCLYQLANIIMNSMLINAMQSTRIDTHTLILQDHCALNIVLWQNKEKFRAKGKIATMTITCAQNNTNKHVMAVEKYMLFHVITGNRRDVKYTFARVM